VVCSTRGVFECSSLLKHGYSSPCSTQAPLSSTMSYQSSRRVPPPQVPSTYSQVPTTSPRRSGSASSRKPYSPPPVSTSRTHTRTPSVSAYSSASHYPSRYQPSTPAPQTPQPQPQPTDYRSYYADEETTHGVQTGAIGGGYGPYSVCDQSHV
jgi:hypothetical protein